MKQKNKSKMIQEVSSKKNKIEGNSLGASGFTLGIISLLSWGIFGVLASFVGFLFCFVQQRNKKTKLGKAGLIINAIAFIFSWLSIFVIIPYLQRVLV